MADELFDVVPSTSSSSSKTTAGNDDARASVVLRVHVQPGAGRAQVAGRHGDALHVRVAPPPQDGRANRAVIELLAEAFDVPAASFELVSGERSREKRVQINDIDLESLRRNLDNALDQAGKNKPGMRRTR